MSLGETTVVIEHRSQFRLPVERLALLKHDVNTILCEALNLTDQGLQLRTEFPIAVGDTIQLECQQEAHNIIHCALVVTHATPPHVGGRITDISAEHRLQLIRHIQELIAQNLGGM
jgi:hypothetical protein